MLWVKGWCCLYVIGEGMMLSLLWVNERVINQSKALKTLTLIVFLKFSNEY